MVDAVEYFRSTNRKANHFVIPLSKRLKCERIEVKPKMSPMYYLNEKKTSKLDSKRSKNEESQDDSFEQNSKYNLRRRRKVNYD